MAKCKYCGYKLERVGALCTDGKNYHKGCLEKHLMTFGRE